MIIGAADSMRDAIMLHFQQAGHGFELHGQSTTSITQTGHEVRMYRSGEIIKALNSNSIDAALIGTDIIKEREMYYQALRRRPPALHHLQTFPDYGRQFITPKLDLVVHLDSYNLGLKGIVPGIIIGTEHPFTIRDLLTKRGFKPQFVGRNGFPPENDRFREVAQRKNEETIRIIEDGEEVQDARMIVGIDEVDGKIPTVLKPGLGNRLPLADIGTIVTESGKTNVDNQLVELETIDEIFMLLVVRQAYIDEDRNERQAEVHELGREFIDAYARSRREFMSRGQKELEAGIGGSPER